MGMIKNGLKKILPPPVNSFMREVNRIVALEEKNQTIMRELMQTVKQQEEKIEKQSVILEKQERQIAKQEKMLQQREEWLKEQAKSAQQIVSALELNKESQNKTFKTLQEQQQCGLNRLARLQAENQNLKNSQQQVEKYIIKQMQQPILEYFVLNILDHCNLRCKGCDHFAAIAEKRFVDIKNIKEDLERMSQLLNQQVVRIGIMGGEPLLHPDLLEILSLARSYFPNTLLQLVTNGLLLMNQSEEFWLTCKEKNIVIVNTKYPINLDYEGMKVRAEQYGVIFEHYGATGKVLKTSYKMTMDPTGMQNARNSYLKCYHANALPLLMEGRFYGCTVAPNVRHFNKKFGTDMQLKDGDYLDIYTINNQQEIFEFLSKPIPFCRYCDVEHRQYGLTWERSKQKKEEWLVE